MGGHRMSAVLERPVQIRNHSQHGYFERVAADLDVMPLHIRLRSKPELFDRRQQRRTGPGSPHSRMVDIWARMNAWENVIADWDESRFKPHESVWYPEAKEIPELRPIVYDLMRIVEGDRLGAVLITKLPAGEKIAPHVDGGWHASNHSKFFVPIQNEEGARYCWEDGYIEPRIGEAWRFDNSAPHWVDNDSKEDRIALIVCIKTERYPA
jgi:hypothetical protein